MTLEVILKDGGVHSYDYRTTLEVIYDGKIIIKQYDGGEPEDNSFGRDWSWVPEAIERAYKLGVLDGRELESLESR